VTFDRLDTGAGKILVIHDGSGVSGFGGVVSETPDVPDVACYIAGAGNAVSLIGGIVNSSGYRKIILDNETRAAWSIPMIEYLGYYSSFSSGGPDFLRRLEGSMSPMAYGMETFAVEEAGLPEKPDQSRVDYLYFSENTYNGNQVRHFPDWFRIDAANAAKYNLTELVK
jgi:hypothetical protein